MIKVYKILTNKYASVALHMALYKYVYDYDYDSRVNLYLEKLP